MDLAWSRTFTVKSNRNYMLYKGVNVTNNYGDYAGFAQQGVDLATIAVATGDTTSHHQCDTEPVWLGKDKFAFEWIDAALLRALRHNTNAQLVLDLRIVPYKAWGTEHPDEVIRNRSGEFASLHALRSGSYTLRLPTGRKRVLDADTGKVLSGSDRTFTFPVQAQQTYWFLFQ